MQQITVLNRDYLNGVIARVFQLKEATLTDEARSYSRDDYEATLRFYRAELRQVLESLPDSAFSAQAPDADGAEVWSAGQISAHVLEAGSEVGSKDMRRFLGLPAVETEFDRFSPYPDGICSRAQALTILDAADRDLNALFDALAPDADLSASGESAYFGPISVGGYLLISCFHEADHTAQAAALA